MSHRSLCKEHNQNSKCLYFECAIHHHLSFRKTWANGASVSFSCTLSKSMSSSFCRNNNRETVPAVCDDQMRQKSTAAMQTCLCSTWNKHFAIIQLHQHHTPSYELEDLKLTVDGSLAPSQVLSFPLDANLYCILWEDKCFFPQIYQIHILVRNTFKRGLFRMGKSEFRVIIHGIFK